MKYIPFLLILFISSFGISQECQINPYLADQYVGEVTTVCGLVTGVTETQDTKGNPVFITMAGEFPDNKFSVVIWGNNKSKWNDEFEKFRGKKIAVTGKVKLYKGKPQIVVNDPSKIRFIN